MTGQSVGCICPRRSASTPEYRQKLSVQSRAPECETRHSRRCIECAHSRRLRRQDRLSVCFLGGNWTRRLPPVVHGPVWSSLSSWSWPWSLVGQAAEAGRRCSSAGWSMAWSLEAENVMLAWLLTAGVAKHATPARPPRQHKYGQRDRQSKPPLRRTGRLRLLRFFLGARLRERPLCGLLHQALYVPSSTRHWALLARPVHARSPRTGRIGHRGPWRAPLRAPGRELPARDECPPRPEVVS